MDSVENREEYRVLVHSLFSSPASMVVSNVTGIFVLVYCWVVSGLSVFGWLALIASFVCILRVNTARRYIKRAHLAATVFDIWRWDREFFLGATVFSLTLGTGIFFSFVATTSDACHLITAICGIAFASGYVARNAGRPLFVIVQLLCFTVPMIAGLLVAAEPYYASIAGYIVVYAITNVIIAFSLNRNLLGLAAAQKKTNELADSIRRKNITLDSALNTMTHGLCMLSRDQRIEVVNSRFLELYGLGRSDVEPGTTLDELERRLVQSHRLTPPTARDVIELCRRTAVLAQAGEQEIKSETGQILVVTVEMAGDGGLLMLTEDASARKAAASQIERMARCDLLTQLPNRFRFAELLAERLAEPACRIALFYIDLDDFKGVNDTMGHEAGDHLLIEVASRLNGLLGGRGVIAEGRSVVGRFGGDEFLMLIDVSSAEEAVAAGREVLGVLAEPMRLGDATLSITTSIGIAMSPEHGWEPGDLLRAADMALYAAKADGRNTVVAYTRELADALSHRREMEADLREAARCGRLSLHYQPIVDARTDQVRSYEALMRWNHPEKGMIPPSEFIPIAEQTGLITQLGAWALRQACLDARNWAETISVAVNVSASQFKDAPQLIENVKDALLISGLDPSRLELEVTESLLIVNQEATLDAIRTLRRIGVRFSLDDFGSGYSSLAYIARYPFSKVKIDRSFAEHLTADSTSRSIIEVVCQLALKLGMRVVVEGIETEQQRREIVALGAEQAQGWLFGRPKPIGDLNQSIRRTAA
ncbi:diguanylate cyclase/phosphodiesterase [Enterovirga rhinocerotis]|uniref:Diguanylate cyclase/phosphodiesterase n=1 Tax=Enterovirga rhinocerotis TaxID=1339210 RepID=A0A4R7BYJ3_9HYPH|nr:diguanylate cyclase/phosphodiesterase [Enterovirga rhinocerotis]